jgi:hypothetical protein
VSAPDGRLDRLRRNVEALGGAAPVPLGDLFSPAFMARYTRFPTFQAMLEASGLPAATPAQAAATFASAAWLTFVAGETGAESWAVLCALAAADWAARWFAS